MCNPFKRNRNKMKLRCFKTKGKGKGYRVQMRDGITNKGAMNQAGPSFDTPEEALAFAVMIKNSDIEIVDEMPHEEPEFNRDNIH